MCPARHINPTSHSSDHGIQGRLALIDPPWNLDRLDGVEEDQAQPRIQDRREKSQRVLRRTTRLLVYGVHYTYDGILTLAT